MTDKMNKIQSTWDKTKGYKTTTGGVLVLLFQLFKLIFPDSLSVEQEELVLNVINILLATGLLDKVWRNRKKIIDFVTKLFKRRAKK